MAKQGFFSRTETGSLAIGKQTLSCPSCGLYKDCESPKIKPYGQGKKKILIIAEQPEEVDDRKGKPWQSKNGRMLARILKKNGIDLFEDCYSIYAVSCYSPDQATEHQINCCRDRVWKYIKEFTPTLILPLGSAAVASLLSHRWKKGVGKIDKWRGWQIPDRETLCWVCPSFAVPFINDFKFPVVKNIFEQDIKSALDCLNTPFPYKKGIEETSAIQYLPQTDEADKILMEYFKRKPELVSFDYETTGLKPHAKGHKIVSCAIGTDKECYSIVYPYGFKALKRILRSRDIGKTAHNMKFEHIWTKVILGYDVNNWIWDSMLSSRIMNNLPGTSGLKFQTYINFGVIDYDSEISNFLRSPGNNGNELNDIFHAPLLKLRKYNGLDTIFGYKLTTTHQRFLGFK